MGHIAKPRCQAGFGHRRCRKRARLMGLCSRHVALRLEGVDVHQVEQLAEPIAPAPAGRRWWWWLGWGAATAGAAALAWLVHA